MIPTPMQMRIVSLADLILNGVIKSFDSHQGPHKVFGSTNLNV